MNLSQYYGMNSIHQNKTVTIQKITFDFDGVWVWIENEKGVQYSVDARYIKELSHLYQYHVAVDPMAGMAVI